MVTGSALSQSSVPEQGAMLGYRLQNPVVNAQHSTQEISFHDSGKAKQNPNHSAHFDEGIRNLPKYFFPLSLLVICLE